MSLVKTALKFIQFIAKISPKSTKEDKQLRDIESEVQRKLVESTTQFFSTSSVHSYSDDDDDDDWGVESATQLKGVYAGYFSSNPEDEIDPIEEQLFPPRLSLFRKKNLALFRNTFVVQKYDETIPQLYSLELEDETVLTSKEHFLKWLRSLNLEEMNRYKSEEELSAESSKDLILEKFRHNIDYIDPFSVAWAQFYYESAWKLMRIGTKESCASCFKLIGEYFSKIPAARITSDIDHEDVQKLNELFKLSLALLEIAALLVNPDNYDRFLDMKSYLLLFNSKNIDMLELIEIKGLCHNIVLFSKKQETFKRCEKIVSKLVEIFSRNSQVSTPTVMIMDPKSHLTTPPTHADMACEALIILHYFLYNISPLTMEYTVDPQKKDFRIMSIQNRMTSSLDPNFHYLLDVNQRTELLNIFYHKLPCMSTFKAFVAFSLGLYCRNISNDYKQAERVLFESVYIFCQTSGFTKAIPSLLSNICTRVLVELAQVLTENNKYTYSSLIFRAAVENQKLINLSYDYTLVNDLAELSIREDDWRSGIYYYTLLLNHANEEKMTAKYGHLSSLLSSLYIERGDFKNAESCITNSLLFMRSQGKSGEYELNLQLTLAKLFLQSYNFERGMDLLARLMEEKITSIQRCTVYINLAEAYLKKRWLKECDFVLFRLGVLMSEQVSILETSGVDPIKILEITARCFLKLSRFSDALCCINIALSQCTAPYVLADLLFLKGKILQKISQDTSPVSFPSTLTSTNKIELVERLREFFGRSTYNYAMDSSLINKRSIYNNPEEVLLDALDCLYKSKELYIICTNELNAAKVDIFIARFQIEYLIVPIVFCGVDPNLLILSKSDGWELDLKEIETKHILPALEVALKTTSVLVALDGYITMAEAKFLQGKRTSAEIFWKHCRDVVFTLFINDTEVVVSKGAPPSFLEKLLTLLKRLVRLMFCLGSKELINNNLSIIDSYLLLETEIEQILKRTSPESNDSTVYDSTYSDSSSESEVEEISLVTKNKIYESLLINTQINSVRTLPFLRRRRKSSVKSNSGRSLKSFNLLKMGPGTGSQSTQSSNGSKSSDGYLDYPSPHDLLSEKIWGCIFRMKLHAKKHHLSEKELNFRNQESMRRLYHLMSIVKQKNSQQFPSYVDIKLEDAQKSEEIDYMKSLLIDYSSIESTRNLGMNTLEKLVYIIHIDSVITFYTPKTGQIIYQKLGKNQPTLNNSSPKSEEKKSTDSKYSFYKSEHSKSSSQSVSQKPAYSANVIPQLEDYLFSLICQPRKDKKINIRVDNTFSLIEHLSRNIVRGPYDYHPNIRHKKKYERINKQLDKFDYIGLFKRMKSKFFSLTPRSTDFSGLPRLSELCYPNSQLILLCSRSLQVLPWELMFDHFISRNFSLQRVVSQENKRNGKMKFKPQYFCFYSEDELKYISPVESDRKKWILECIKKGLNIQNESVNSGVFHDSLPNLPFHCPIIGYGRKPKSKSDRYKFVNFVKLSSISENPTQIITHIESYNSAQDFPVFILSFSDLLDLSEAIICLLNFRPDCTLLFFPESVMSIALEFLMDMQIVYTNSGQLANSRLTPSENSRNGYRFFLHSLQLIKKCLKIPLIVINPPTISNEGRNGSSSSTSSE
ncbi:hypothetical protein NAEGRDRAFT_78855 [Naegleria gruberi]|uniref:Uncharacterized protein n=1 Tax=Naegleria gruberi TaxID=5762 RepID=D2V740_NAEGR|nr:uncharacterized protein NAEGRDRAFT_78855 [Naegleria gruberi]EFC47304.1 hypothetical protein NAEGRDRAFT_78855 [Naegleria gruberi]|eukprot:XP_002680048.1 hypothetical protein NAEGRDRAFT_78855 [Naegleria gruberi strain NEG-M]